MPVTERHAKVSEALSLEKLGGRKEEDKTKLNLVNKFISNKVKNW